MDARSFDALALGLAARRDRRRLTAGLAALALAAASDVGSASSARGKKKKKTSCKRPTIKCGGACVNPKTDERHCGECGRRCPSGETCVGGKCTASGCGPNEIDCDNDGTRCIPDAPQACCSQADCGGVNTFNEIICDTARGRCVCDPASNKAGWGICQRFENGSGSCGPCCPGATIAQPCSGELVCRNGSCNCPAERPEICTFNSSKCSMDLDTDPQRCGPDCRDCTTRDPGAVCCQGDCIRGCAPGAIGSCAFEPCAPGCAPCPEGQICCNQGLGTPGLCVPSAPFCPLP